MNLISLIVVIILAGVLVYVVDTLLPIRQTFKNAVYVVVVVFLILYVLQALGLLGHLNLRLR